jgi:predicted lipid-binding transport protein (Tim44 family)
MTTRLLKDHTRPRLRPERQSTPWSQADDLWTFRRQIGSDDPDWVLAEAESA